MKPSRNAIACSLMLAFFVLVAGLAAQQRTNQNSNTERGGEDVRQVPGRKIGTVTTRGNIIELELDAGVIKQNLFDLDRRSIRFTPAGGGFKAENLSLQWDAARRGTLPEYRDQLVQILSKLAHLSKLASRLQVCYSNNAAAKPHHY